MKFTVLQKHLLRGVNVVNKAVNVRSPLPVLGNVLIKAGRGGLRLTASDLQVTISVQIGAKVDSKGEITIPARLLLDFISQVTDEKINGKLDGSVLTLKTERVKATFAGMPSSEFPKIDDMKDGEPLELDSEELIKAVSRVQFAVAVDEGRPVLTGIYFSVSDKTLTLAGTDGFRMAEYKMNLKKKVKSSFNCILPAKTLAEIIKTFGAGSKTINLLFNLEKNLVTLKVEDMEANIRMIEGEYPDYEAIVPADFSTEVVISKEELTGGVKLVSVFAKDLGYAIKFTINKDGIKAQSQPTEAGSNSVKMVAKVKGEGLEIGFNGKYLLDLLNGVEAQRIVINTLEPLKPGLFKVDKEENYWYIVMPMKTNW